jgi:hypothetical protein
VIPVLRSSDLCTADRETVRILARAVKAAKATEQAERQRKALEAARR